MATHHSTAPARAGERSRSASRAVRFVSHSAAGSSFLSELLTDEPLPGSIEPWQAVAPVRPDTAYVRAPRIADIAGEALTAALLIAGGVFAFGFMPGA